MMRFPAPPAPPLPPRGECASIPGRLCRAPGPVSSAAAPSQSPGNRRGEIKADLLAQISKAQDLKLPQQKAYAAHASSSSQDDMGGAVSAFKMGQEAQDRAGELVIAVADDHMPGTGHINIDGMGSELQKLLNVGVVHEL